jgi:hypothetical protein
MVNVDKLELMFIFLIIECLFSVLFYYNNHIKVLENIAKFLCLLQVMYLVTYIG